MQMNGCTVIKTRRLTRSNCDVKRIVKSSRRNCSLFLLFLCLCLAEDIFKRYSISFSIEFNKDFEEIYEDDIWIIFQLLQQVANALEQRRNLSNFDFIYHEFSFKNI